MPPRLQAPEADLRAHGSGSRYVHALDQPTQARIWSLREAALGLSMAMKDDAKSLSFVEDTAVPPEHLAAYTETFRALLHRHGLQAGFYRHASVGCLHVRPFLDVTDPAQGATMRAGANEAKDPAARLGLGYARAATPGVHRAADRLVQPAHADHRRRTWGNAHRAPRRSRVTRRSTRPTSSDRVTVSTR